MKTCSMCGLEKPRSEFYNKTAALDGKQGHCKLCHRGVARAWYRDREHFHIRRGAA